MVTHGTLQSSARAGPIAWRRPAPCARGRAGARRRPVGAPRAAPSPSDFDNMALDDEYYKELGMTPEEAAEQLEDLWNVDPEAYFMDEGAAQRGPDERGAAPGEAPPYGPPAILLAGFRDHEPAMARATLDMLGGQAVKVLPALGPLLWGTVAEALAQPEPDWEAPRPEAGPRSGDWGSQRTLMFSGLSQEDALAILDVFEEGGLPQLMVAVASSENAQRVLGEVLAEAIQEQRRHKLRGVEYPPMQAQQLAEAEAAASPAQLHRPQPPAARSRDAERVPVRAVAAAREAQASQQPQAPQASQEQAQAQAQAQAQPSPPQQQARQAGQGQPQPAEQQTLAGQDQRQPRQQSEARQQQPPQPRGSSSRPAPAAAAGRPAAAGPGARQQRTQGAEPAAAAAAADRATGGSGGGGGGVPQQGTSAAEVRESFQASMKEGSAAFLANFEHNSFASEQRELRAAAAEEMAARAERSRVAGAAARQLEPENLIDAAAAGEDTDALLQPRGGGDAADASQEASKQAARGRMEAVLQQMRESAGRLPPEQQQQLAADLKVLEREQETVEQVLTQMGASLDSVPPGDREVLKAKLREEALQPTRDAIGAALACGVTAAELRGMVAEAEADARANRGGWYPSLAQLERKGGPPAQGA